MGEDATPITAEHLERTAREMEARLAARKEKDQDDPTGNAGLKKVVKKIQKDLLPRLQTVLPARSFQSEHRVPSGRPGPQLQKVVRHRATLPRLILAPLAPFPQPNHRTNHPHTKGPTQLLLSRHLFTLSRLYCPHRLSRSI